MCSTTVHRLQHVRKKVRHVGQSAWGQSHFDLVNPYHADFDVELSLCSKNRILAAGYNKKITTITQNFRHQNGSESTISTPPSFSVYETQHDDRLGKTHGRWQLRWRHLSLGLAI